MSTPTSSTEEATPRREIDVEDVGSRAAYKLLNSVVVPRPIAWVSTRSADGVDNVAPHSFFTVSCVDPPVVQFTSVGRKDSLRNVEQTREFVVNMVTEDLAERANDSSTNFPSDVDEFAEAGLVREPSVQVAPWRVADSPVSIECTLAGTTSFGDSTVVFGRVLRIAVAERVWRDGRPQIDLLRPVARLGAAEWATIGTVFSLRRVPFGEWQEGARAHRT